VKGEDAFHFAGLSQEAQDGIKACYEAHGWEDLYGWITADDAAMMFFRLREVEDRPEWFPKGKSATIQRIEQMLIDAVRAGMAA